MKKFYLLSSFLVAVFSKSLFAMQQPQGSKDSVVITIGTEVKDVEKNKGGIRNWFNRLSQNKKNAMGALACGCFGIGIDLAKCSLVGCSGITVPWGESKIAAAALTVALLRITSDYKIKNRFFTGFLSWAAISTICFIGKFDFAITGQTSLYYTLFSPFFAMKK